MSTPNVIDGFRATASGPGMGRGGVPELNSVERGAERRLSGRDPNRGDRTKALALRAARARNALHRAIAEVLNVHDAITAHQRPDGAVDVYCSVARSAGLPYDDAWEVLYRTKFEGIMDWPEPRPVCRWVYDFTRAQRRLPAPKELREHLAKGVIRMHATGAAR